LVFFVYIIECMDGSFYTGYTKDLKQRLRQHQDGKGAKYTKAHKPSKVAYCEHFDVQGEAMRRERQIKKLSHQAKQELIDSKKPKPA
jgi:putative endonuclease